MFVYIVCLSESVRIWKRMKGRERGNGIEMMRKGKKTVIIELYYGGLDE